MILYDQVNNTYVQDDVLQYIRDNKNQETARTVQIYLNQKARATEIYLNKKIFYKQIFDLSPRKIAFQATNFTTDYSSKKVFLTILNEKEKSNPLFSDLGRLRSQALVETLVQVGKPNYYFAYSRDFTSVNNICPMKK
jgi:hypothetical protein